MHTSAEGASSANGCIESTQSVMHATKLGPKLGFYPDNHPLGGGAVLVVVGGFLSSPVRKFFRRSKILPSPVRDLSYF